MHSTLTVRNKYQLSVEVFVILDLKKLKISNKWFLFSSFNITVIGNKQISHKPAQYKGEDIFVNMNKTSHRS